MKEIAHIQTQSAAVSIDGTPIDLADLRDYSIEAEFSGTDVRGTLRLEIRNDTSLSWKLLPGSVQEVRFSEDHIWTEKTAAYRFVRARWTYQSGTGNITAKAVLKDPLARLGPAYA